MKRLFYSIIVLFVVSVIFQGCGSKSEITNNSQPSETSEIDGTEKEENLSSHSQVEVFPPDGEGQIGLSAVVLSEGLPVHQNPDADSEVMTTLQYGDLIILLRQSDGWSEYVRSDSVDEVPAGWVEAACLLIDPAWLRTNEKTPLYARKDTTAPELALLDGNTILPILKDEGDWLMVSLDGATGWIYNGMAG